MFAIVPVLVVVLLSLIVTRVATIALTLTGLSRQSARFQARSALTGVGFTTTESESMVNHPIRRRIVMLLMLIGSSTIVIVIAQLIVATVQSSQDGADDLLLSYGLLVVGLALIVWLFSLPRVDRTLQRLIRRLLRRYTDLDIRDYASLLHVHGDFAVSEMSLAEGSWLTGQTLADLRLSDEGVLVLGVQRDDEYFGAPKGHTVCRPGDVLVLYGHAHRLADLDQRPSGSIGRRLHQQAVGDQQVVEASQRLAEQATGSQGDDGSPPRAGSGRDQRPTRDARDARDGRQGRDATPDERPTTASH